MSRARGGSGRSLATVFAAAMATATLLPLVATLTLWRFVYSGNATRSLGLSQIRDALAGTVALLGTYPPVPELMRDSLAFARLRRLVNGPIASIRVGSAGPAEVEAALAAFLGQAAPKASGEFIADASGARVGERNADGSWTISEPAWVARCAARWDAASEEDRRRLANAAVFIRVERDITKAVLRVGKAGYVWAITSGYAPGKPAYELLHPQIEAVEVGDLANARGERIGVEISRLRGLIGTARANELVRYDYAWKNPGDPGERKKITLLSYIPGSEIVICAGLYEDEYFLPAQAASILFVAMVLAIGAITIALLLGILRRVNGSLAELTRFSETTAAALDRASEPPRSGIRELDALASAMVEMEGQILARQRALAREVEEKNALLMEVHHRVKNNLSVLASIVSLQLDEAEGEEAKAALSRTRGRVASMAQAYQQLVESGEYARIPFDEYLRDLLAYYQCGVAPGMPRVARAERLDPCPVRIEAAVPLGLIAQELVANAYEHGASPSREPEIAVSLVREGDSMTLEVADNGEGMAEEAVERTGLLLVRILSEQIGAELSILPHGGPAGGALVRVAARFPMLP